MTWVSISPSLKPNEYGELPTYILPVDCGYWNQESKIKEFISREEALKFINNYKRPFGRAGCVDFKLDSMKIDTSNVIWGIRRFTLPNNSLEEN